MGQDSYLPLKKSGQSVIDQNLPYRFLRGQPLKTGADDVIIPPLGSYRAPNDDFLLNTLKTLLRLSKVVLDLQKYILSGAIKLVTVRSSQGTLNLFKISRASVLYSRKILNAIYRFTNVRIFLMPISITLLNPKILGFLFLRKTALLGK